MPENLSDRNVMVGITRSKVFYACPSLFPPVVFGLLPRLPDLRPSFHNMPQMCQHQSVQK